MWAEVFSEQFSDTFWTRFGHVCKKETLSIEYAFLIAKIDVRRSGRVAEGTPLLRVQTGKNRSRGFESLLLRHLLNSQLAIASWDFLLSDDGKRR